MLYKAGRCSGASVRSPPLCEWQRFSNRERRCLFDPTEVGAQGRDHCSMGARLPCVSPCPPRLWLTHILPLALVLVLALARGPAESTGCLLSLVAPSSAVPVPQHAAQHAEGRGILQRDAAAVTLWTCLWAAPHCHYRLRWLRAPRGEPGQAAPCSCPRRPGLAEAVALVAEESRH